MASFDLARVGMDLAFPNVIRKLPASLRLTAYLILLLAASFLFCLYISRQSGFLGAQMNSDMLLAISYIWDLGQHDHAWHGFQLPRIPSIFPDLMIQAAAVSVAPSYGWSLFIYAWIQIALFGLAAAHIAALLTARPHYQTIAVSGILIAAAALADAWLPGSTGITSNYFMACIHFGPFVTALIAGAIAWRLLQDWRYVPAVLLFGVSTLSILSNKLLLAAFAVPVSLAAVATARMLMPGRMANARRVVAVVAASALAAYVLDRGINRQPDIAIEWTRAPARLQSFLLETFAFVGNHMWVVIVCVLLPAAVFVSYSRALLRNGWARLQKRSWSEADLAGVFFWLQGACAMAAVMAAVALLAYTDHGSYRYLAPVLTWPIIFTIAAVVANSLARKAAYAVGAAIVAFCAADLLARGDVTPGTVSWRSPMADCILANRERFGLRAGIAEYWVSRPVMFGSNWTLQVNQATGDGHPYIWGNNRYWYTKAFGNQSGVPTYNFVVMERMDPAGVARRFGQPSQRIECPAGQEIWVYDDGKRMTDLFLKPFAPPSGAYQESCRGMMRVGSQISGQCRRRNGTWRWASLDVRRCPAGDIRNHNGNLRC